MASEPFSDPEMSLAEAVRNRRSVRGYLDKPVPDGVLRSIFELAQQAPSNCNIMPWKVFVASGETRDLVKKQLIEAVSCGQVANPDHSSPKFSGEYRTRQVDCAMALYSHMGIAREDKEGRARALLRNFELFDAPHIAFIGMHKDFSTTVAVDVGMYAQNLMLAMTAYGVGSCAMGSMRHYPDIPRGVFDIKEDIGILFGLCFGYEDEKVDANKTRIVKDDVTDSVTFLS